MGRIFKKYLDLDKIYSCRQCKTHLSAHQDIISKNFQGRTGKAYLFEKIINVSFGPIEDRILMTGLHSVADIYCNSCLSVIGWTYHAAQEESQKYKENKYIIEMAKVQASWI